MPPSSLPPQPPVPPGPSVADVSEDDLLRLIFPLLPAGAATLLGPGDDAAVVSAPDGRFVVSTDVLVEGRHFRREWSSGEDVGRRAAVQNLADVAAMGARPTSVVVGLVAPGDLPVDWVTGFARGLAAACAPHGVGVVGGDLSGGDAVMVSVAVHGDLEGRAPVLRSGARPGDVVGHAGVRGRSAAGLALLTAGRPEASPALVAGYLRPECPLDAGPAAARAGATAMLDVSDGLLRDAGRIARASGVVVDLDPVAGAFADDVAALRDVAALLGQEAEDWVLTGGEDHGLLATFPAGTALPHPFRAVGRVRAVDDALQDDAPQHDDALQDDGAPSEGGGGAARATGRTGPTVLVGGSAPRPALPGWDHFARGARDAR